MTTPRKISSKPIPSPAPPRPIVSTAAYDLVPIERWAEYRAAHPVLEFTGEFDREGRAVWVLVSPKTPENYQN